MLYELATLSLKLRTVPTALPALETYTARDAAGGRLLGCWEPEHGHIVGQLLLLRASRTPRNSTASGSGC
ncbi:hypothetical protein NKH77_47725 [Streptomyces sp. M19]